MSTWARVQYAVRCAYGHDVGRGVMVYFGRNKSAICADHMQEHYQMAPPSSSAQPCGCDAGAGWVCARHQDDPPPDEPGLTFAGDD